VQWHRAVKLFVLIDQFKRSI